MSAARRGILVALAATAAVLAGCSSPDTAARLNSALGPTFARLYAVQQQRLGHVLPARGPDGRAQCFRGGGVVSPGATPTGTGTAGAGDDWTCTVVYPYPDGHLEPITYDVALAATGCYSASGPSAVVGGQTLQTPSGKAVVNPLYAFDGCLTS